MSAELAAAKAAVAVASDKRGRIAIATILCSIIIFIQQLIGREIEETGDMNQIEKNNFNLSI